MAAALPLIVGFLFIFVGILFICVSLPLIQHQVKMNGMYGVRTPESFASEENWYRINEFGGRKLMHSSSIWIVGGIVIMLSPNLSNLFSYPIALTIFYGLILLIPILSLLFAVIPIIRFSQKFRKSN